MPVWYRISEASPQYKWPAAVKKTLGVYLLTYYTEPKKLLTLSWSSKVRFHITLWNPILLTYDFLVVDGTVHLLFRI